MNRQYDLFEQLSDGLPVWRGQAPGLVEARRQLLELSRTTTNECFAIHLPTREITARVNVHLAEGRKPFVFQISYDEETSKARSEVLRRHGYEVTTVFGNEAAKLILSAPHHCNLFVIGHAAPEEFRREMVEWLKANYPGIPIIALNRHSVLKLPGADYNLKMNGPETLLPLITAALTSKRDGTSTAG